MAHMPHEMEIEIKVKRNKKLWRTLAILIDHVAALVFMVLFLIKRDAAYIGLSALFSSQANYLRLQELERVP